MKNGKRFAIVALAAAFLFVWPHQSIMSDTAQFVNNETVFVNALFEIEIYGFGIQTYSVSGTWNLSWSDPEVMPDDHIEFQTEIVQMDLSSDEIIITHQTGLPSPGTVRSLAPGIDFPAESFFDVFVEVEIPGILPGEKLHNSEGIALGDLDCGCWPECFVGGPDPGPDPNRVLLNDLMEAVGTIRCVGASVSDYYPPVTHLFVDNMKGSDILEPDRDDENLFRISAEVSGTHDVMSMEFSYREAGSVDPWIPFALDTDGSDESFSTVEDKGEGDGWSGYLDRWSFPPDGEWYELQATANTVRNGPVSGILDSIFIDPTPHFPTFVNIDPDSIVYVKQDSLVILLVKLLKYIIQPANVKLQIFPLGVDFKRTLTPVNQLAMGYDTTLNKKSCGPAAAASCLKYFADNGHPELEHPGGDTGKSKQTGEQMAGELRGAMGTNTRRGTTTRGMKAGIRSYLDSHGKSGWTVKSKKIRDNGDIGDMFDEFEADGEDVMMVLENTLPNGKKVQHCVTLGSKGSTIYERNTPTYSAMCVSHRLDFMDPWGGEGTDKHEYNVGYDRDGKPTLEGYKVDDKARENATIKKFIKVSPPATSGGSRAAIPAAPDPGWIEVDTGVLQGGGVIDTFYWDSTGFPPGLYLLEVVVETADGQTCRDLRLAGIPEYLVGADPPTPETPTKLIGSYPNPFNPMTTIEFFVAGDTKVDITIYDAAGRAVRHLVRSRPYGTGTHQVRWNGINDSGTNVSSGVYFYRFSAGGVEFNSKLVLLR